MMSEKSDKKLSVEAYKGVRDFYPMDMFIQNYIFGVMRKTVESFGYIEYSASILEPAELYRSKTSEEIVNEQTYTFMDRGEREVTLRPEMTPTIARMIAGKRRELAFPLRWYSIPNAFRYERPQRGRLREYWQLNCDLFGVPDIEGDIETIWLMYSIMLSFGASVDNFQIELNDRQVLIGEIETKLHDKALLAQALRLVDKKGKMNPEEFEREWKKLSDVQFQISAQMNERTQKVVEALKGRGVSNIVYNPILVRGFDYYTGIVFEVFDTGGKNNRSLFGGGRYDNLLDVFCEEKIPAVGFGMGDVTIKDFLETYGLLPEYKPTTELYIARIGEKLDAQVEDIADKLRSFGLNVAVDLTGKKVGDQIKIADRQSIPFIIVVGEEELKTGRFKLKNLKSREEQDANLDEITSIIKKPINEKNSI